MEESLRVLDETAAGRRGGGYADDDDDVSSVSTMATGMESRPESVLSVADSIQGIWNKRYYRQGELTSSLTPTKDPLKELRDRRRRGSDRRGESRRSSQRAPRRSQRLDHSDVASTSTEVERQRLGATRAALGLRDDVAEAWTALRASLTQRPRDPRRSSRRSESGRRSRNQAETREPSIQSRSGTGRSARSRRSSNKRRVRSVRRRRVVSEDDTGISGGGGYGDDGEYASGTGGVRRSGWRGSRSSRPASTRSGEGRRGGRSGSSRRRSSTRASSSKPSGVVLPTDLMLGKCVRVNDSSDGVIRYIGL